MSTMASSRAASFVLLTALSLWLGWGIRGNFGHEYGAMIPGALAAMAAVLLSGRDDWHRRIVYFAMFGALGWSFGGSISYMLVVAYTHSGHSLSVLYGFSCLFVIGFLWAALGGAGTALPAVADQRFIDSLFLPMGVVFLFWWLQGAAIEPMLSHGGFKLDWYDSDWLAATLALFGVLMVWAIQRRLDSATSLILHLAAGWWAGFAVLVLGLGLHMTPPRGDNWAGCLGMTAGLFLYCSRERFPELARAALYSGFIGGSGFAAASMLKLVEVTSGYQTNWHSILEQTTGLFNGIGVAAAVASLALRTPPRDEMSESRPWTEPFAFAFVLLGISYLNLRKNVGRWVDAKSMPAEMAGLPAWAWFDLGYVVAACVLFILWKRNMRQALAIVPESWLGKGQLLYLVLLWLLVVGNFERALVAFRAERLVTEGVLYLVAALCTLIVLLSPVEGFIFAHDQPVPTVALGRPGLAAVAGVGLVAASISIMGDWAIVRAIYGDRFAGHASLQIRFGPRATIDPPKTAPPAKP
jgi:hypothetical protein